MPNSTPTGVVEAPAPTTGLDSPEFTTELLAALDAGYELEEYLAARAAGVTYQELIELDLPPNRTPSEYIAARVAGSTPTEVAEVIAFSHPRFDEIGLDEYAEGRTAGASHAELIAAHAQGVSAYRYGAAHAAGATYDEIVAMRDYYGDYALARASGATHQEVLAAQEANVDVANYDVIRSMGTTHAQTLEVLQTYSSESAGPGVGWYLGALWKGLTHDQAMSELAAFYAPR